MKTIKFILFFLPFIMKAQTVDLLDAITFHNTIRTYQLNPMLEYDSDLSLSAEAWANVIIRTGDLIYDNNVSSDIGELLYRVDATDEIMLLSFMVKRMSLSLRDKCFLAQTKK